MAKRSTQDFLFRWLGDTDDLERASKRASKALGNTGQSATKAGKSFDVLKKGAGALAVAFGAREIVQGIGSAISAASDLGESVNAVEVTMGDAAAGIMEFGETAATELGLSKRAVNEAAVAFSAFGEKIDAGNVAGVFEDYITRATDFASVMNLDVGEAVDKFRSGLAGESEPLRAFGIDLSAASVAAYAVANGIAESASSMTEAEKIQARYGLLMQQTEKVAGDFANTSESLANQTRSLSAAWEDAQAEIGENLIPAVEAAIPLLVDMAEAAGRSPASFSLGASAIDRFVKNASPLEALGFTDFWTDADEAVYKFDKTIGHAIDRIRSGEDAWQVTANLMGHLAKEGALTTDVLAAMQQELDLTDAEMVQATDSVLGMADAYGLTAEQAWLLNHRTEDVRDSAARAAVVLEEDFAEGARESAYEAWQAAHATEDLAENTKSLEEEMRSLADPVFKAKKAVGEYEQALEDAREDGKVTADELEDLAEKWLDAEAAASAVGETNLDNYEAALEAVGEDAGVVADELERAKRSADGLSDAESAAFAGLNDFVSRLEAVTDSTLQINLSGLRFATDSEIEQAITRALYSLQRKGVVKNIAI